MLQQTKTFSVVLKCFNCYNELLESKILDSTTRSGVTRKANAWLKECFFQPIKKVELENYQHWYCYDIADIELKRIRDNGHTN